MSFLVASLVVSLVVSTVENPSSPDPLANIDPRGQTVRFWHQHTRERKDTLSELIAEFNRSNPHRIKVVPEYAGRYGDIYNKMIAGLRTGDVAELIVAYRAKR